MGQEASRPQPGKKLQVIGAGLPRTGTTSFSQALSILLDGPVHHCGTQISKGASYNIKTWTDILKLTPIRSGDDEKRVMDKLSQLLDGYVAVTDTPACVFVPELIKLYPDAKVICTIRDSDEWAKSLDKTAGGATVWFFGLVLMFNNPMRHFTAWMAAMKEGRWGEVFPSRKTSSGAQEGQIWERHLAFLREHVAPEKLIFFDVRDGWGPLCEALGCEVPKGIDFPRSNDSKAMEEIFRSEIRTGIRRWAMVLGTVVASYWGWKAYLA
ncbi:P-loop containing nucleoside triphosphate hydrolase protein [Xylariaceae sp. FL0594]|nr:P-loop containing nucleoside triphosphate hydrolase protein [Xylariaceae sp. FL0594]